MGAVVIVGAQWGDEGKGKFVDLLSASANQSVRFNGGANAGHTMMVGGQKLVFHLIPCGALHKGVVCVMAQGMVVDPKVLVDEIGELKKRGIFDPERLVVSDRAHLVMPQHILLDELRERGQGAIGTTKRGIGPAYEDKVARRGLRVGDLLSPAKFRAKVRENLEACRPIIGSLDGKVPETEPVCDEYLELAEKFKQCIGDSAKRISDALDRGEKVLMEAAQGSMLDVDSGTYPFVTSSSTVAAGACTGAGIGPTSISVVVGVSKAYTTRVGNGPFPTELTDELGENLRGRGQEYGATTGRPRRCGWLDITALRYAVRINGMTAIALSKIDVLSGLDSVKLCTAYELDGRKLDTPPYDDFHRVKPIYESFAGWKEPLGDCRKWDDLPANARNYIRAIEDASGRKVWMVSVGADREQTIILRNPLA